MQVQINNQFSELFFKKIKQFLYILIFSFSLIQLYFSDFGIEVFFILICINLITFFNFEISLKKNNLIYYLIPTLVVLSVNFFYLLLPLFIKTLLAQKINSNLELGLKSFMISSVYVIVVNFSLIIFKNLTKFENKKVIKKSFLSNFNVFYYLNFKTTILIFFTLLFFKFYLAIYQNSLEKFNDFGNVYLKFFYGFEELFYLPIIYVFIIYYELNKIDKKKFYFFLIINIFFSVLFAILTNNRTEIFEMIIIIFFCFFFYFMQGKLKLNKSKFLLIIILIIIFSSILENLSKRILEIRSVRFDITPVELFKLTTGLTSIDHKIVSNYSDYKNLNQEYIYTGHNILDRFTPIKHLDKSLYDSTFLSLNDLYEFKKFSNFKMLSFIPQNILNLFDKNFSKVDYQVAVGSKIERLAYNRFGGDFNKGSYLIELFLITNSYFLTFFFVIIIYLIYFKIISLFQKQNSNFIILSPIVILLIFEILYSTQSDSLSAFLNLCFRQPIQLIILLNLILIFKKKKHN